MADWWQITPDNQFPKELNIRPPDSLKCLAANTNYRDRILVEGLQPGWVLKIEPIKPDWLHFDSKTMEIWGKTPIKPEPFEWQIKITFNNGPELYKMHKEAFTRTGDPESFNEMLRWADYAEYKTAKNKQIASREIHLATVVITVILIMLSPIVLAWLIKLLA